MGGGRGGGGGAAGPAEADSSQYLDLGDGQAPRMEVFSAAECAEISLDPEYALIHLYRHHCIRLGLRI